MKWLLAILVLAVVGCSAESDITTDFDITTDGDVTTNSIGMKLKLIPAGTLMMGSEEGDDDEQPVHQVTLTQPFLLGVYEVTQEKQRCQESLFVLAGKLRTRGRPLGRNVDSRSRRRAVDSTHVSSPNGLPRLTLQRTDFNSLSLSGSLTRSTQLACRASGHGDSNFGAGLGLESHRHSDPHLQFSARSMSSACNAFRST